MGYLLRRLISVVTHPFVGGGMKCFKCHRSHKICKMRETQISDHEAIIVLCVACWYELTPKQRIPYYKLLMIDWLDYDEDAWEDWPEIEKAVLEGK